MGAIASLLLSAAVALPPGFADEPVLHGLDQQPVDAAFLPDGRMLVLEKTGRISILDPFAETVTAEEYLTVPSVVASVPTGAMSLVVDPDFAGNGRIYVYLLAGKSPFSSRLRLSRFLHEDGLGGAASEAVVWESAADWEGASHLGGGLDIGPDGQLYLAVGDENHASWAQDLTRCAGSILRIAPDGSVPLDNPFADGPGGNDDFIWAYGLRNPFRARWDAPTGRLLVTEAGAGVEDWEDLHLGAAGANFGWPFCTAGPCDAPWHDECTCDLYAGPIHSYPRPGVQAAIIGGLVYGGVMFPTDPYAGAYFYADHMQRWIRYLTFAPDGTTVVSDVDFGETEGRVLDFEVGPEGALYYVHVDTCMGPPGACTIGGVRRIRYDDGGLPPAIVSAAATPVAGQEPLLVSFTAEATDDDPAELEYRWTFGDGSEAAGAEAEHEYASVGIYAARLRVSDATHTTLSPAIMIEVGLAPSVRIEEPTGAVPFRGGQEIAFSATAEDDDPLGPESFSWTVRRVVDGEAEVVHGPVAGASGSFEVPSSGFELDEAGAYEFTVSVTDQDGLEATDSVVVPPDLVELTLDSQPRGVALRAGAQVRAAPWSGLALVDAELQIVAPDAWCLGPDLHAFLAWSDGGAAAHQIVVPTRDEIVVAAFGPGTAPAGDVDVDGLVDVGDLVAVILAWGACDAGPGACPEDLDCDGVVGIDDMLAVILAWTG